MELYGTFSKSHFYYRSKSALDEKTMKRVTKSSAKEVVKKFLEDMKRERKSKTDLSRSQSKSARTAVFKFFPSEGTPNVTIEDHSTLHCLKITQNVPFQFFLILVVAPIFVLLNCHAWKCLALLFDCNVE